MGLTDARNTIENCLFEPRGLRRSLVFQAIKEMGGVLQRPHQIVAGAGGSWLVYEYNHHDVPDITTWHTTTERFVFPW